MTTGTAVALLVLAAGRSWSSDEPPLSPELLAAETIFVKQTLIDPKIVSRFRSELSRWDRYEVVASIDDADLVATLSAEVEYTATVSDSGSIEDEDLPGASGRAGDTGPRPVGTVRVLEDIHLSVVLDDGTEVWKDAVSAGSLTGNASKRLFKRLQKRVEEAAD